MILRLVLPQLGPQVARLSRFESPAVQRLSIIINNTPTIQRAEFRQSGTPNSMRGLPNADRLGILQAPNAIATILSLPTPLHLSTL